MTRSLPHSHTTGAAGLPGSSASSTRVIRTPRWAFAVGSDDRSCYPYGPSDRSRHRPVLKPHPIRFTRFLFPSVVSGTTAATNTMNFDIYRPLLALTVLTPTACVSTFHPEIHMSDSESIKDDVRAIEALNRQDVQFALAGDKTKMMSQWTDDFVLLPPAGPIMRGRAVIAKAFEDVESPEIVDYALDIQEVTVLGDHAFEWGTYHYTVRPRGRGEPVRTSGKLMRILQRQPDRSWKIYRGMSTVDVLTK
jgi:uncharacterized protein (TIGR02246 family)